MRYAFTSLFGLIILIHCLIGCGGEPEEEEIPDPPIEQEELQSFAMVLETSELTLAPSLSEDPADQQAINYLTRLVTDDAPKNRGFMVTIDESYQRERQLRILLEPSDSSLAKIDFESEADLLFEYLKWKFDMNARQAAYAELAERTRQARLFETEVQSAQQELRSFQESVRGLPDSNEIRLERRKLERTIETSLEEKIEAEKLIDSAQKRIDRGQFVTLLRVK
ncbi:MAG: hypothetical protein AAF711_11350 [Planctomycetota bacterium]